MKENIISKLNEYKVEPDIEQREKIIALGQERK